MLATSLKPIRYTLDTVEGKHVYTIEGEALSLDSVTTNLRIINKPALNDWRVSMGKDESDRLKTEGGDIGRMVHEAGLRLFKGEGYAEYETAMAAFDLVDPIYRKAVEYTRPLAAKWAEQNADKPCINVMAQGPLFGAAYVFSICNVQEMLQIDSSTITTCDFFHGPFEILDKRTSLFQLISVGRSRCNDERGIRFVNQYGGERVYQLDAKELGLNDIKDSVSEYFNHLIFAPILNNVYMRALSAVTHKDYMTRRYMWKLDY